jgi:GTP-binding protein
VERTGLLVHLVEAVPVDGSDPLRNYRMIRRELEQYSPALAARPELVVVTKMDLTGADESRDRVARELGREVMVMAISAVTGKGVPALLHAIDQRLQELREPEAKDAHPVSSASPGPEALPVPTADV